MMTNGLSRLRAQNLAVRVVVLVLAAMALCLVVAPVAWWRGGSDELAVAAGAAACCLAGACAALVAAEPLRGGEHFLYGMLLGMAFRLGIPLAVAMVVCRNSAWLVQAGFLGYLVVFFEAVLFVEVWLALPPADNGKPAETR